MNKKKQEIFYLIFNTKINGGNRVVFEHVNRLAARGNKIHIFTIIGLQPKWFPLKIKIERFYSLFRKNPDILVVTFWPTVYISFFLRAKKKFHLVQAWEEDFYKNNIIKKIVSYSTKILIQKITVSDYLKNKIEKNNKNKFKILKIDGNAVDPIFKPPKRKFTTKHPLILSIFSSFQWYKGFDLYLKAVDKLKNRKYRFLMISSKNKNINLKTSTAINPSRRELAGFYQKADVFLSTSRSEGFLLPALEAMASGCPVIVKNSGGINEYARNGYNAIIFNKIDELWKKNIIDRLFLNDNLRSKLITNGLKTANKFKWEKIISQLEIIYNNT